jgi:hypothetical protein
MTNETSSPSSGTSLVSLGVWDAFWLVKNIFVHFKACHRFIPTAFPLIMDIPLVDLLLMANPPKFQPRWHQDVFSPALCLVISKYFDTPSFADCFIEQLHEIVATTWPLEKFVLFRSSCLTVESHRVTICILVCLDSFPP